MNVSLQPFHEFVAFMPQGQAIEQWSAETLEVLEVLYKESCVFPPWITWDLYNAHRSELCRPGAEALKIPQCREWRAWTQHHWGPLTQDARTGAQGESGISKLILHLATATGALETAQTTNARYLIDHLNAAQECAAHGKWWSWPGGERLRQIIVENIDPIEVIGTSAALELVTRLGRCDPFLHDWSPAARNKKKLTPPAGNSPGRNSPEHEDAETGNFSRRGVGRLPENLIRLAPIEHLYMSEVPTLFFQRVAENSLEQRFYKRLRQSDRRLRVEVVISLRDNSDLHQFEENNPPPIHEYRRLLAELLTSLAQESNRGSVELDVLIAFTDIFNQVTRRRVEKRILGGLLLGNHRTALVQMSQLVPGFVAHHPVKLSCKKDSRRASKHFDQRFEIQLLSGTVLPGAQPPSESEGETIRCQLDTRRMWEIDFQSRVSVSEAKTTEDAANLMARAVLSTDLQTEINPVSTEDWSIQ